jgi:hypothetical protein
MLKDFESGFVTEETEITVLLKDSSNGAAVLGDWLRPSVNFLASIDNDTGEMIKEEGRLEWMIKKDPDRKGWGYDFEQYGIYKLLVRKCIPRKLESFESATLNNCYMIVKVLEENVQNDKLLEYKEYLSKPVEIDTPYGKFVLDRSMSWFEGEIELNGLDFTAFLETDEDNGETAELALKVFLKTAENFEDFDRKNKEFAADNLLDLAHEWQESDEGENEPLTREQFIEAIGVSEWTVTPYGNMTLYYYDGDIFWGHAIEINIDEDGTIEDADIAG